MQTFLPYPDFEKSLICLDKRRLGKQRVESWQILQTISGNSSGWKNHPAIKMWARFEEALKLYYNLSLDIWASYGYKNTKLQPIQIGTIVLPTWIGMEDFHASHRSNLLRKNPKWYGNFGWLETPDLPYIWPTEIKY